MSRLQDSEYDSHGSVWPFLRRMLAYALKYPALFWAFVLSVFVVALIDAAFPLVYTQLIDNALKPMVENTGEVIDAGTAMDRIWVYVAIFGALSIAQVVAIHYFIKQAGRVENNILYDLRRFMFDKLQQLEFAFYDKSAVGWLMSRITSDSGRVTEVVSWGLLEGVWGLTMIFVCLIVMFVTDWQLALLVTVSIPILLMVSVKIRLLILRYSRRARKLNSEITARYNEHINGVEVNKSTAQEQRASEGFRGLSLEMRLSSFKAQFYTAMYMPLVIFMGSLVAAMVIIVGGQRNIGLAVTQVGTLVLFFTYAMRIFEPIYDITHFYANAQGAISAGERIFSLLDAPVEITDKADARGFPRIKGEVSLENVSFYYEKGKPVLDDVTLHVRAGESIALVGATGGGKSTIVNLVPRFYDVQEGSVKIDGHDVRDMTMESLRSQLGIVLQTPHLFSGSIRDNVRYGNSDADDAAVIEALRTVGAEEFITRLDEEVGENGDKLSLGEKQLMSFARAVLVNPRIFIMDEATSSIDAYTEMRIQRSIEQMIEGRTAFIIAHRLSTIRNADRILFVKRGKIVEEGGHDELMQRRGEYYHLYTSQLRSSRGEDNQPGDETAPANLAPAGA